MFFTLCYIGDLRSFSNGEYISYINIDKVHQKRSNMELVKPNDIQMDIIENELNKNYISPNLMDKNITYREFLNKKGIYI
jgi:hypothetical protein